MNTEDKDFFIDSENLALFRQTYERLVQSIPYLHKTAQIRVVIDANFAVFDLVHKIKNPHLNQTALEEIHKANIVIIHAPIWLDHEMVTSTIPQVAKKKKIDPMLMLNLWQDYKKKIVFDFELDKPEEVKDGKGDPKDMPYIKAMELVDAAGILSRDNDIKEMGGKTFQMDFVLSMREYARTAAISVTLHAGGAMLGVVGLMLLVKLLQASFALLARLPKELKLILLVGVLFCIINPRIRQSIVNFISSQADELKKLKPEIDELIKLLQEKNNAAEASLSKVNMMMESV